MKTSSEIIKQTGLTGKQLEKSIDLLKGKVEKNKYGHFVFNNEQVMQLWEIRILKALSYNKESIRKILYAPDYTFQTSISMQIDELQKKIDDLEKLKTIAEQLRDMDLELAFDDRVIRDLTFTQIFKLFEKRETINQLIAEALNGESDVFVNYINSNEEGILEKFKVLSNIKTIQSDEEKIHIENVIDAILELMTPEPCYMLDAILTLKTVITDMLNTPNNSVVSVEIANVIISIIREKYIENVTRINHTIENLIKGLSATYSVDIPPNGFSVKIIVEKFYKDLYGMLPKDDADRLISGYMKILNDDDLVKDITNVEGIEKITRYYVEAISIYKMDINRDSSMGMEEMI